MTQIVNKLRYIKPLKKDQNLENKNSSLYKEDKVEYRELLYYGVILYNFIEKYVTNEIDSLLLRLHFFQIQIEDNKIKKDLEKNFEIIFN